MRVDLICDIVEQPRSGIHDLSRTESDADSELPRFNMPLELGIFLGARRYGKGVVRDWLSHHAPEDTMLPGSRKVSSRDASFCEQLLEILATRAIEPEEMIYNDYTTLLVQWLEENPW